jgi:serine protease Do
MNRPTLRTLTYCTLLSFAMAGGAQAQTPAAAPAPAASLPDFTGIVQKNAPAVVHVESKYTGQHASQDAADQQSPDDAQ